MSRERITPRADGSLIKWVDDRGRPGPLVVSYFTDHFYLVQAFDLARSCQAIGLDYHIEQVPDGGDWWKNTNHKPTHLLRMHALYNARVLLWLDADARVRQYPHLLDSVRTSIAFRTLNKTPLSGTVLLPATRDRERLLDHWVHQCKNAPTVTDQVCMERAVNAAFLARTELPPSYCWIFDHDEKGEQELHPSPARSVVIEHMQASRWSRLIKRRK